MQLRYFRWTLAFLSLGLLGVPATAAGEAWAGLRGQLDTSLDLGFQFSNGVYFGEHGRITGLPSQNASAELGAEFTPIERLTLGAELTGSMDRYSGPQTGVDPNIVIAHGSQDDGDWHSSLTDAEFRARYQLIEGLTALSPSLRVQTPVTDYEVQGYAAAGTGLSELGAGVSLGNVGLLHNQMVLHGGYEFTLVESLDEGEEETNEFSVHYSRFALQAGYLFTRDFNASLGTTFRWTHGGLHLDERDTWTETQDEWHDPILARRFLALGAAAGYSATDSLSFNASVSALVWGDNVTDPILISTSATWTTHLF